MKSYIHARLSPADRSVLQALKHATGRTESEIVRHGLHLMADEAGRRCSALKLAGRSVGRFKKGPRDLSVHKKRLEGFGE